MPSSEKERERLGEASERTKNEKREIKSREMKRTTDGRAVPCSDILVPFLDLWQLIVLIVLFAIENVNVPFAHRSTCNTIKPIGMCSHLTLAQRQISRKNAIISL